MKRLPLFLRIAWAEFRTDRAYAWALMLTLTIGSLGLGTVDIFTRSFSADLNRRSTSLVGGDIMAASSYPMSPEVSQQIDALFSSPPKKASRRAMFTMANTGDRSRLISLVAASENFPLYGHVRTVGNTTLATLAVGEILIEKQLAVQLQIEIGSKLILGEKSFVVRDLIDEDTTAQSLGFATAPRAYIRAEELDGTGLVQVGSRIRHEYLYGLPMERTVAEALVTKARSFLDNDMITIADHREASQEIGRFIAIVADFLGLASLVGLLLSGIGTFFLVQKFVRDRLHTIAITRTLGAPSSFGWRMVVSQIVFAGLLCALTGAIGSVGTANFLSYALKKYWNYSFSIQATWTSFAIVAIGMLANALIAAWPVLASLKNIRSQILLQDTQPDLNIGRRPLLTAIVAALVFYWLGAAYLSHSFLSASTFIGTLTVGSLVSVGLSRLLFWYIQRRRPHLQNWITRFVAAMTLYLRSQNYALIFCLSLGIMFLNLPLQVGHSIKQEIAIDRIHTQPNFFLFDIQDDQVGELQTFITSQNLTLNHLSPLIRARLTKVNDREPQRRSEDAIQTRESQRADAFRSRTYNLSYRDRLSTSEAIIAGKDFSGRHSGDAAQEIELSLETRFAERIGVVIGDRMEFDIQGVVFSGRVISLRKVRWTSFEPNYFVLVQAGVLDDAPKSFLASVAGLPRGSISKQAEFQQTLISKFSNVSMVNVEDTVQRIAVLTDQISWVIVFISILTAASALAVLASVIASNNGSYRYVTALLKVLGTGHQTARKILVVQHALTLITATVLGTLGSLIISSVFCEIVFDTAPVPQFSSLAITTLGLVGAATLLISASVRRVLQAKPISLL
jgi:putative ABC transport system permease protein